MRTALRVAAALLLIGAGVSAWIWNARRALPYNEQGRYFEAEGAVVLHQQSATIYGLLAAGLAVIGAICWLAARRD